MHTLLPHTASHRLAPPRTASHRLAKGKCTQHNLWFLQRPLSPMSCYVCVKFWKIYRRVLHYSTQMLFSGKGLRPVSLVTFVIWLLTHTRPHMARGQGSWVTITIPHLFLTSTTECSTDVLSEPPSICSISTTPRWNLIQPYVSTWTSQVLP